MMASTNFDVNKDMSVLWDDQTMLTHNVVLCLVDNQPGIDAAKEQLVKNQAAIGSTLAIYYGEEAGKKLTKLLYLSTTNAADLMIATRNGNYNAVEKADKKWKASTDQTLLFLNQTNPNWDLNDLRTMMYNHIQYATDDAALLKAKRLTVSLKLNVDRFNEVDL